MIKVDVQSAAFKAEVQQAIANMKDRKPLLLKMGNFVVHKLHEGFAAQRDPMGTPWADLSPSTWRQKTSGAILRERGTLASSIQTLGAGSESIRIGSRGVPYGIYHQTGTSKMPQRQFVGYNPAWTPKLEKLATKYIERLF